MPATPEHLAEARQMGVDAALAAASWIIDGNTPDDHIHRMVAWIDDCDPRADDYLPRRPDLSGEWADDLTPNSLARDILGGDLDDDDPEWIDAICDAWETGVSDTFDVECERILRAAI